MPELIYSSAVNKVQVTLESSTKKGATCRTYVLEAMWDIQGCFSRKQWLERKDECDML